MSELLKSDLVGSENKSNEEIVRVWENSGLLEGVTDDILKIKIALTLENSAKILIKDIDNNSISALVTFPIIRRILSTIDMGTFKECIEGDYNEIKPILIQSITSEFIINQINELFEPTLEAFESMRDSANIEAEACAIVSDRITQLYLNGFSVSKP